MLFPTIHQLTCFQESRSQALLCLYHVAQLPYSTIFPFKTRVINILQRALDDKKRIVRKQAVKTRNEWFVLKNG